MSDVLASTLDYLPTIAAVAGVRLPTDRSFDGVDLLPVLLRQHGAQGHSDLFHPNSGASGVIGALDAVRHLQYKAVWQTGGAFGCGTGNIARRKRMSKAPKHHQSAKAARGRGTGRSRGSRVRCRGGPALMALIGPCESRP